jgi:K+-transporting ATPase A subunit
MASAARAVGCGPLFTASSIASFSQGFPQSTVTPVCHSCRVSPKGCPNTIRGMGCSRLLATFGLPLALCIAWGWCISISPKFTVRCLASSLILVMWARMVFVAWGPFRGRWASCKLGLYNSGLLFAVTCLYIQTPYLSATLSFILHVLYRGPMTFTKCLILNEVFDLVGVGADGMVVLVAAPVYVCSYRVTSSQCSVQGPG